MSQTETTAQRSLPPRFFETLEQEVLLSQDMLTILQAEQKALVAMDMQALLRLSDKKENRLSRIQALDSLLAEMTGSPVLRRYVAELGYRCALILSLYSRPHSSDCAVSEHREIVAALVSGDAGRAVALMDHHLDAVAERARILNEPQREHDLIRLLAPYVEG